MKGPGLNKNAVKENLEIATGVFILSFEKQYDFIPGQIIALSPDVDDREPSLYSICSGAGEDVISILYNIVPEGKITGRLSSLQLGGYSYTSNPCGRAEMVVEARDILISRSIPYNMIESEIYF